MTQSALFIFRSGIFALILLSPLAHLESRIPSGCLLLGNKLAEARSSKQPGYFAHDFVGQTFGKDSAGVCLWWPGSHWGSSVCTQGPSGIPDVPSAWPLHPPRGWGSSLHGRAGVISLIAGWLASLQAGVPVEGLESLPAFAAQFAELSPQKCVRPPVWCALGRIGQDGV